MYTVQILKYRAKYRQVPVIKCAGVSKVHMLHGVRVIQQVTVYINIPMLHGVRVIQQVTVYINISSLNPRYLWSEKNDNCLRCPAKCESCADQQVLNMLQLKYFFSFLLFLKKTQKKSLNPSHSLCLWLILGLQALKQLVSDILKFEPLNSLKF